MNRIFIFLLLAPLWAHSQETVRTRCRALLLSDTAYALEQSYRMTDDVQYNNDATGYYATLAPDGHWPDIDYHSEMKGDWKPSWHLYRVMLLCRAYYKNRRPDCLAAIHRALHFWIRNDFQCSNWWQNQINIPYAFSSILLMLDKDATPDELAYLDNILTPRVPIHNATGQNLIWQLDNQARIALLHNDAPALDHVLEDMQRVISVSTAEGIQPDYSFQQHGPMLQFGNYGLHFVNTLVFWMTVTAGFRPEKAQILSAYCSQGLRWSVFKGSMDLTVIGRQLRVDCDTKRGQVLRDDLNLLRSFAGVDVTAPTGNKSFWRSGYMVQQGGFMMSVKTNGSFVHRIESINGENLLGAFLNDGVTQVRRTGLEYHNIAPFWNWTMLPGTTGDTSIDPGGREAMASANQSDFVGQVSDTAEGVSAMRYNRLGVQAYKSYFLVDGMLVALGAGITSSHRESLVTTVEQRLTAPGTLEATGTAGPLEPTGTTEFADAPDSGRNASGQRWFWQDSTGYLLLDPDQPVVATTGPRTGNWNTLDKASPDRRLTATISTIYLPHTVKDSYAYVVTPGIGKAAAAESPVKVLSNTPALQAIQVNGKVLAVFYKEGTLGSIHVDKPCLVIYRPGATLWLSDPTRLLYEVGVSVGEKKWQVSLPSGTYAGATTSVDIHQ